MYMIYMSGTVANKRYKPWRSYMNSRAYEEGFSSSLRAEYINPYPEDSSEFDDYERGRSQKIKRCAAGNDFSDSLDPWTPYLEPVRELSDSSKKSTSRDKPNSYALAKGK